MRTALALTAILALALSGCSSSDNDDTTGTMTGDGTTGTNTGAPTGSGTTGPAGNGTALHYSCKVTVGLTGLNYVGGEYGGCEITDGIESDATLQTITAPSGCTVWSDTGNGYDAEAEQGADYDKDTAFAVFCDATMTPNSEASVDLTPVA